VKDAELALARQVIESLQSEFDPEELQSEYRRDLRAMLEAKLAGEEIARPEPVEEDAPVVDLMEALRKSVAEASKAKAPAGKAAAKKKTAARPKAKAAARKSA
jgi:DNA end-binding protein Ku